MPLPRDVERVVPGAAQRPGPRALRGRDAVQRAPARGASSSGARRGPGRGRAPSRERLRARDAFCRGVARAARGPRRRARRCSPRPPPRGGWSPSWRRELSASRPIRVCKARRASARGASRVRKRGTLSHTRRRPVVGFVSETGFGRAPPRAFSRAKAHSKGVGGVGRSRPFLPFRENAEQNRPVPRRRSADRLQNSRTAGGARRAEYE